MNKDQAKGAAKNIGGKIQEQVGKLTGNEHQQAAGVKNQIKGKIQEKVGDLKETVADLKKN